MTSLEAGHEPKMSLTEGAVERSSTTAQVKQELGELDQAIWQGVPPNAKAYLSDEAKCPAKLRALAIAEARKLLAENPAALDDVDAAELIELPECVKKAENAATKARIELKTADKDALHSQEAKLDAENAALDTEIKEGNTTVKVLSKEFDQMVREEFDKGGSIDKKLEAIATGMADVPNNEVALAKINQAREMIVALRSVVTDPNEQVALEQILSSSFVDVGADTMSVAFASVMDQVTTSDQFSKETKEKLDRLVWAKTGGQVNEALDAVDENGQPLHTEDNNPVNVGHGTIAYTKPDGSRAARVTLPNGRSREMPWNRNESDDVIGTKISLAKIWEQNEWDGQTDFFGESIDIENDILSQTDPAKLRKVQQTINALLGGMRGYDAVIVRDDEANFIGWLNQFSSPKGDAMQRDFDKNTAVENRTNLGFHPNGDPNIIDYDVLRAAALFAKGQFGSGTPDYFALQRHLHEMFPEKNIPLTGENAPDETSEDS